MRALVFTRAGVVELLDVSEPVVGPGETLVHVESVGICGSELHGIRSTDFRRPPLIMGHEFTGITESGDRVVVNPLLNCGQCDQCKRGSEHLCRQRKILGIHRPGAFAERISVPTSMLHPLSAEMSFDEGSLIEPLANAVHALSLTTVEPHCRVGIFGAGTIGLMALTVSRQYTLDVSVADLAEERLALAGRLGAATVGNELVGEFDLVIDAVGAASTHAAAVEHVRPGGTAIWLGLLSSDPGFDGQSIVRDEKRVIGSYCYTRRDFEEAIRLSIRSDMSWGTPLPFSEGAEIFMALAQGKSSITKALLQPQKDHDQ